MLYLLQWIFHVQYNELCHIQIQESWTFVLFQSAASVSGEDDEELKECRSLS
jgi:hypothetical protein